jgi:glycosyltransferase involved in cell wall biosynthesis
MAVDQSDVTIIIPAYNERDAIGAVVQDLKAALPGAEIIVVNDGSTDETEERARIAGAHIIRHDSRLGYGAALKSGIAHSSRAYVLFCDGDGQHSIDDVRRLIEACDGYDMVVGARTAESHTPFLRKPGKLILKWFANFIAGVNIPDLNSGLRILKRDVLVRYLHLMPLGFSFSTTSTFAMLKANRRFKFIPITTGKRVGSSTVRQLRHGPVTLMLMLRIMVLFEPLKVFLSVALGLLIASLISLSIDLHHRGGLADTTVLLAISCLIIFMFGLLCDQVSALRRELHN